MVDPHSGPDNGIEDDDSHDGDEDNDNDDHEDDHDNDDVPYPHSALLHRPVVTEAVRCNLKR